MKREVAFLLEGRSPVIGSVGRTRSSKVPRGKINAVSDSVGGKRPRKRDLGGSDPRVSIGDSCLKESGKVECDEDSENVEEIVVNATPLNVEVTDGTDAGLVDRKSIQSEEHTGDLRELMYEGEATTEFIRQSIEEGLSVETAIVVDDIGEVDNLSSPERPTRRVTRSSFKRMAEPAKNASTSERSTRRVTRSSLNLMAEVDENAQKLKAEADLNASPAERRVRQCTRPHPKLMTEPVKAASQPKGPVGQLYQSTSKPMPKPEENALPPQWSIEPSNRSSLNPDAELVENTSPPESANNLVSGYSDSRDSNNDEKAMKVCEDSVIEAKALRTLKKNLELKLSKKISLNTTPSTVKELLETGLLEGLPVTYNNITGRKLRGIIKGVGISCSCKSCKGCEVFTPSKFELHACRAYRNAARYICLENAKSLQQVVQACRNTSTDNLEATIQEAVGYRNTSDENSEATIQEAVDCRNTSNDNFEATIQDAVGCRNTSNENLAAAIQEAVGCRNTSNDNLEATIQEAVGCRNTTNDNLEATIQEAAGCRNTSNDNLEATIQEAVGCRNTSNDNFKATIQQAVGCPNTSNDNLEGTNQEAIGCENTSNDNLEATIREAVDCQKTSNGNLEATIQEAVGYRNTSNDNLAAPIPAAVGSLPARKPIICQNCNGSFTALDFSEERSLCNSCINSMTLQAESTHRSGRGVRSLNLASTSKSFESSMLSISSKSKSELKITKKHLGLHKLVFEEGGLPDGTELAYYARGQKSVSGYKTGSGIFCYCCQCEVSASVFEIHAGHGTHKKPYHSIYTSNGVSLHELAVSLSRSRKFAAMDNDDLCIICSDGGDLLLCDGCPRAFHRECVSLPSIPRGDWYCKYCQNMLLKESFVAHNVNAFAAGRVSGVDPIEQITKRCIRIIQTPDTGVGGCALCRGYDFLKSGFDRRTVILCDQCEREFHVGCLRDHNIVDLKELPKGKWFCCEDCSRIHLTVQMLLDCGGVKLSDPLLDVIRKKYKGQALETSDLDVRWRLLSGKLASSETKLLLSKAVAIFHDCFDPIVDPVTGRDLIPCMVYGRNLKGQEFGRMYCALLTVNSMVVSTGILRIFGPDVAELPLVATCNGSQGKGYFQTLFSCIERLLSFLKIKNLVLPAAGEAESIWTEKFGFKRMAPEQLCSFRKQCWQMTSFKGTSMLHKAVPEDSLELIWRPFLFWTRGGSSFL